MSPIGTPQAVSRNLRGEPDCSVAIDNTFAIKRRVERGVGDGLSLRASSATGVASRGVRDGLDQGPYRQLCRRPAAAGGARHHCRGSGTDACLRRCGRTHRASRINASIVSLSSKRDQTCCARRSTYTRDLLNSNLALRCSNFMVGTECGPTLRRIGHLTLALTVSPPERQPVMCGRRDAPGWPREEGSMIANHTERRTSRIRTSLAVPTFGFFLFRLSILVDAMGGASLPHLAAEEGRMLEISC